MCGTGLAGSTTVLFVFLLFLFLFFTISGLTMGLHGTSKVLEGFKKHVVEHRPLPIDRKSEGDKRR